MGWYYKEKSKYDKSIKCLKKAYKKGLHIAIYLLADIYQKHNDDTKAINYYHRLAELGYSKAYYALAKHFMVKDFKKALAFLSKGAKKEHPGSLYLLANIYTKGKIVQKDSLKAVGFMQRAARLGHIKAMNYLDNSGIEY